MDELFGDSFRFHAGDHEVFVVHGECVQQFATIQSGVVAERFRYFLFPEIESAALGIPIERFHSDQINHTPKAIGVRGRTGTDGDLQRERH